MFAKPKAVNHCLSLARAPTGSSASPLSSIEHQAAMMFGPTIPITESARRSAFTNFIDEISQAMAELKDINNEGKMTRTQTTLQPPS